MKRARAPHPDFQKARIQHRWTGSLPGLRKTLEHEAIVNAASPDAGHSGRYAYRILPGGASVGMRLHLGRLQIRIARSERPAFGRVGAWEREVATFLEQMDANDWERSGDDSTGIAVLFTAPATPAPCASCGDPRDEAALLYGERVCTGCGVRLKAGREIDRRRVG